MSRNSSLNNRVKHIDIRYHYIRKMVLDGTVIVEHIPSEDNPADIMTKPLGREVHKKHLENLTSETNDFSDD